MANQPIKDAAYKDIQGLRLAYATTATMTVASGKVRDANNVNDITLDSAATINTANNGLNGLDTGTIANSTQYAVYLIGDSTKYKATGAILSTDTDAPLYPLGYDMCRRIGFIYTDGSAQILPFQQTGNSVDRAMWYDTPFQELTNGQSATWADVDCGSSVPDQATLIYLLAAQTPSAAGRAVYVRRNGSSATNGSGRLSGDVNAVETWGELTVPCDSDAIFEYKVDNASDSVDLYVKGYLDSL